MSFTTCYGCSANGRKSILRLLGAGIFCLIATGPALSQAGHAPPINPFQPNTSLDLNQAQAKRPNKPVAVPGLAQAPGAAAADATPFMTLADVSVTGAYTIPPEAIAQCYEPYIGKSVSQADLVAITDKITAVYRAAGFHLSRAIVPPQDIQNGHIQIAVIEGSVTAIDVKGDRATEFGVERALKPIIGETPSRLATFERHLLLASNLPGVRILDSALEEIGETSGHFRLTVTVATSRASATVAGDNLGSSSVGPGEGFLTTTLNSMLVPGDGFAGSASTVPDKPDELAFGRAAYDAPVGANGARVGATVWYSSIWPGDYRRQWNTQTDSTAAEIRGSIMPIETQKSALRLTVSVGGGYFTEKDIWGRIYADQTRTATFAADENYNDALGGHDYVGLALRQGFGGVLGATGEDDPLVSHGGASGTFSILGFAFSRYQALNDTWSIRVAGAGQFAAEPLMYSQQFYIGGAAFGRGYDAGLISGDDGVAGAAELRFDRNFNFKWAKSYELYAFVDSGVAWDYHDDIGTLYLVSAGVGARIFITDNFQAGVAVAFPVDYHIGIGEHQSPRFLFTLTDTFRECGTGHMCWF
jgi:hemolysin activation/secretion protein